MSEEANLERLIGVDWDRNTRWVSGLGVDVMAALHMFQLPTLCFKEPCEFLPREAFHTAISIICSFPDTTRSEMSTDRHASTAS